MSPGKAQRGNPTPDPFAPLDFKETFQKPQTKLTGESKYIQMKNIGDNQFYKRIKTRDKEEYDVDIGMSGCSCTLVIIIDKDIYTAHIGDSMVCLSKEYVSK